MKLEYSLLAGLLLAVCAPAEEFQAWEDASNRYRAVSVDEPLARPALPAPE